MDVVEKMKLWKSRYGGRESDRDSYDESDSEREGCWNGSLDEDA